MAVEPAKYNVFNGTDFDQICFETDADLVKIKDTAGKFASTDVEGALKENADKIGNLTSDLASHKDDYATHLETEMPHQFKDLKNNKTYKFGFQLSDEGNPQLIYEEVA